jgi:phosphoglycolate phosphatase
MTDLTTRQFLVFDLDGTLIDSNADLAEALNYAATTVGGVPEAAIDRALVHSYMGKNIHQTFTALLPADRHDRMDELVAAFRAYYREHGLVNTTVFPGALALLERLRRAGKVLAIATTKYHPNTLHLAEVLGLTPYFDFIQGTEHGDWPSKPDPFILNFLMKKAGVSPAQSLMIGDTDNDVLCAQNAGVPVIAVSWGAWSAAQLQELKPDALANNFDELVALLLRQ